MQLVHFSPFPLSSDCQKKKTEIELKKLWAWRTWCHESQSRSRWKNNHGSLRAGQAAADRSSGNGFRQWLMASRVLSVATRKADPIEVKCSRSGRVVCCMWPAAVLTVCSFVARKKRKKTVKRKKRVVCVSCEKEEKEEKEESEEKEHGEWERRERREWRERFRFF